MTTPCECPEHRCDPDPTQTDRYPIVGGALLCARCYALGHGAPLRLRYAGLMDTDEANDMLAEMKAARGDDDGEV